MRCPVCFEEYAEENIYPLSSCEHIFHEDCLKYYLEAKIKEQAPKIVCPQDGCGVEMGVGDLQGVLEEELLEKYYSYTLDAAIAQDDDMWWCPTADCNYAFNWNIEEDGAEFECEKCKKIYCLECKVEWHKGMTCAENRVNNTHSKADEKFEKAMKRSKAKQCSKCKYWVSRTEGCNHMTCRCGFEFCYNCGDKYEWKNDGPCECRREQRRRWRE